MLRKILLIVLQVGTILVEMLLISTDEPPLSYRSNNNTTSGNNNDHGNPNHHPERDSNDESHNSNHDDARDNDDCFNQRTDQQALLQAAFRYFEIDQPNEITRESVKKKWKRLSLVHHPDRNNQSEESVHEMQKINRYYAILEEELDRRENNNNNTATNNDCDKHQNSSNTSHSPPTTYESDDPDEPGISRQEYRNRRKRRKKEQKRQQEELKRRQKEREAELRREWKEAQRQAKEFQKRQKSARQANERKASRQRLCTEGGRAAAHRQWKHETILRHSNRNDDDDDDARSNVGSPTRSPDTDFHNIDEDASRSNSNSHCPAPTQKPINPIMEYSNDQVAMALRLGATDVAVELVHESIQVVLAEAWQAILRHKLYNYRQPNITKEDRDEIDTLAYRGVLLAPIDDDGNHVLHYAVYHGDNEMLTYLTFQARRLGQFADYLTSTNNRGDSVLDYCIGSTDRAFRARVQDLYTEASDLQEQQAEELARSQNAVLFLQDLSNDL